MDLANTELRTADGLHQPAGGAWPGERSRKIGILTFHRCINYGAYWQMRCLRDFLLAAGHEVQLLDYHSRDYFWRELKHAIRPFRPAPRRDVAAFAAKALKFIAAQQRVKRTGKFPLHAPPDFSDFDLVVVGSDEVWNLSHPWLGGVPLFFGESLAPRRLVAYAASFGNYDSGRGLAPEWIARLRRFDCISVRDTNSCDLIRRHMDMEPTLVLDPCLQFTPAPARLTAPRFGPAYLLLYGNRFTPEFAREVRAWAQARHLRIVSIGYRNDWADVSLLSAGPDEFVHRFRHASAVATSYFHGCVFALRFHQPFVAQLSPYRSNKIRGFLTLVGAMHRIFDPARSAQVAQLLSTPIESETIAIIDARRQQSLGFLAHCLRL
ncbi:MAG TPA: polysaccharide pyruvyl transferase family protein [Opitutus sp.]|nr:polysaccharide pyruvyl transferase family protein [Opitutus sp.]